MISQKNALCLIFHRPKIYYFDFLNKLKNYDIYVIIDNNLIDYSRYKNRF